MSDPQSAKRRIMDLGDLHNAGSGLPVPEGQEQEAGAAGVAQKAAGLTGVRRRAISSRRCCNASVSGRRASAAALPFRTGALPTLPAHRQPVCAAGAADRLRGARRRAGRPDLPAAGTRARRRRSPEGAGAHLAPVARAVHDREAAGLEGSRRALCGADRSRPPRTRPEPRRRCAISRARQARRAPCRRR